MITDHSGTRIDEATALRCSVAAVDGPVCDRTTEAELVGRLLGELGELAEAVLAVEQDAPFTPVLDDPWSAATRGLHDVLRAVGGVAHHCEIQIRLPGTARRPRPGNPHVMLTQLTHAAGLLAQRLDDLASMGSKGGKQGHGADIGQVARAVDLVLDRTFGLADHYGLRDALRVSLETSYRICEREGRVPDGL